MVDQWPRDEVLQLIASENNLSETAFILADAHEYQLRWFTPTQEVPLCGHATLAAGFVIMNNLEQGRAEVHFTSLSGLLTVRKDGHWFELDLPSFDALPKGDVPAALEAGLQFEAGEVFRTEGDTNYFVIVDDEAIVRNLQPRLEALATLHPYGVAVSAPGREADFVSRYFAPSYGIPEDPVTGSIHAALTPYWARRFGRTMLRAMQLSARGGELRCTLERGRVLVAGQAAQYLDGHIEVPTCTG